MKGSSIIRKPVQLLHLWCFISPEIEQHRNFRDRQMSRLSYAAQNEDEAKMEPGDRAGAQLGWVPRTGWVPPPVPSPSQAPRVLPATGCTCLSARLALSTALGALKCTGSRSVPRSESLLFSCIGRNRTWSCDQHCSIPHFALRKNTFPLQIFLLKWTDFGFQVF